MSRHLTVMTRFQQRNSPAIKLVCNCISQKCQTIRFLNIHVLSYSDIIKGCLTSVYTLVLSIKKFLHEKWRPNKGFRTTGLTTALLTFNKHKVNAESLVQNPGTALPLHRRLCGRQGSGREMLSYSGKIYSNSVNSGMTLKSLVLHPSLII